MKVDDLLNRVGTRLAEDFTYSPLWTKAELLDYLKETLKRFSSLTRIVDRHSVRLVETDENRFGGYSSSASLVPDDFNEAFYVQYNQKAVDLVRLNDLDFMGDGWTRTDTGTPLAASCVDSGPLTLMTLNPSPTTPAGAYGADIQTSLYLESPGGTNFEVTIESGALVTTAGGSGTASTPTLPGVGGSAWDLTVDDLGVLSTAASVSGTDTIYIEDEDTDYIYFLHTDAAGVLDPKDITRGLAIRVKLDNTDQDFVGGTNSASVHAGDPNYEEYGVVVDAYATGVSTEPDSVCLVDKPVGLTSIDRNMDDAATIYYLGSIEEPYNLQATIFIHGCFVPIIEHGILAKAYAADNSGHDTDKASMLEQIFVAECMAIREMFGRK